MDYFSLIKVAKTAYVGMKAGKEYKIIAKSLIKPVSVFCAGTLVEAAVEEVTDIIINNFEENE